MGRKVLLSFLGNSTYQKCKYEQGNFQSQEVRFVQEALLQLLEDDWTNTDKVYLFLTPAAEQSNWEGAFYEGAGLKKVFANYPNFSVEAITDIPAGFSEAEIWDLFERIYNCLEAADEIYLDITHSFRSLPMLLMVLVDYAKALKNIKVAKIYYGAFEATSPYPKTKKTNITTPERTAPILELTSFSALQDWTAAASDFKLYGKLNRLKTLTDTSIAPLLKSGKNETTVLNLLTEINEHIQILIPLVQTNRGKALALFPYDDLKDKLSRFSQAESLIKPLTAVIHEIQNKVQHFREEDSLFWLKAAKWCRDHGLIQQGITQLQEGFITWLCWKFQKEVDAEFFEFTEDRPRRLISNTFKIWKENIGNKKWKSINRSNKPLTRAVAADPSFQQATDCFIQLSHLRNDINHGGYQHHSAPDSFYQKLSDSIETLEGIVINSATPSITLENKQGLLNISYELFENWSAKQQQLALDRYGNVADILLPTITPKLHKVDFEQLVEAYYRKVKIQRPKAVYLMGEPTFTFALVQRLKSAGISCIGSVGKQAVMDQAAGQIFVGFRAY